MGWTLDAFFENPSPALTEDDVAAECIKVTGDPTAKVDYDKNPFTGGRLGVRLQWENWFVKVLFLTEEDAVASAQHLANSRTPPAETRKRVATCNRCVRVMFGSDKEDAYLEHIIAIMGYLDRLSDRRVYDPQQRNFTTAKQRVSKPKDK